MTFFNNCTQRVTFTYQPSATTHTINYEFSGFYHNTVLYEGNKFFTRVMTLATATSPAHPVVTLNLDVTATFLNGKTY